MDTNPWPVAVHDLFFDLDGTLVDSLPGIEYSIRQAFAACGMRCPEFDLRSEMGPPIGVMLHRIGPGATEAQLERLEQEFRKSYDSSGWQRTRCYAGLSRSLEELTAAGSRCYLFTNKPLAVTRKVIEAAGILRFFDEVVTRDCIMPPFLSKTAMLQFLLTRHRVDREHALVVGDAIEDYEAAERTGIAFALVRYGYGSVRVRHSHPGCFTLGSLEQLTNLSRTESERFEPAEGAPEASQPW